MPWKEPCGDPLQFQYGPDNRDKLKELYELLESATDRCEDVADVIQNISVKNL